MVLLVDTVAVPAAALAQYADALRTRAIPLMTEAGATLERLAIGDPELEDPVTVELSWSVSDFVEWNEVRKTLVLDARYYELGMLLHGMRTGGTRRFLRSESP